MRTVVVFACALVPLSPVESFSTAPILWTLKTPVSSRSGKTLIATTSPSTSVSEGDAINVGKPALTPSEQTTKEEKQLLRKEGGLFAFKTKYGALNPFGIYYGLTAILLGIPWFIALTLYQLFRVVTFNRLDKKRVIPVFISQTWGVLLLRLTRSFPKTENMDKLSKFYKEKRPAMFVANHNSWMDIPFLGTTVGWRNYKLVSKAELRKVPVLGKAIEVGGNIMVDRTNRKSQLKTLKQGIQMLKEGVHLCTFPEGTRSRSGRLAKFKNGAFKMAHKAGAPIIPMSIVGAAKVHPAHWMFPHRAAHNVAKVVVHDPIESEGITEEELTDRVRQALISGLSEEQRPLDE